MANLKNIGDKSKTLHIAQQTLKDAESMAKFNLTHKQKNELWWLIISVDFDYSRIAIADHELTDDGLTLWLEDKNDFKNTLDECLQLDLSTKTFAKLIKEEGFNSYETTRMHTKKNFLYNTRVAINEPVTWYQQDATVVQQQWAREAVLKNIMTNLVESEVRSA